MNKDIVTLSNNERGVTVITLNRPEVHNAFDGELVHSLSMALKSVEEDENVRIVIIAANGKSFCAGADIIWMRQMGLANEDENKRDAESIAELLGILDGLSKPTISLIQGNAYGGGVGLISATDIAIAVSKASFAITETRVGVIPSVISPFVINKIGESHARRYFLTGERFSSEQACKMGLVHDVVSSDALAVRCEEYVQLLLKGGPQAQHEAKKLISATRGKVFNSDLKSDLAKRIAKVRVSNEGQEGLLAFHEKRKANWI